MAPPAKKMKRCNNKENKLNNSIKNYFKTVEQPESPLASPVAKETKKAKQEVTKVAKPKQQKKFKEKSEQTKMTPEKSNQVEVAEKTIKAAIIEKPKKVVKKSKKATKTISEDQNDVPTQSEPSNFALTSLKFKNLAELYPWVDEKLTRIVFKTKSSMEILMSEFCLFSTYKCMNEVCEFFTTDFDEFKKHMIEHSDSNCHYCSFCLKGFEEPSELGTHIDLNHRYDRFQCNNCMYRSCQKGYVAIHQNKFHPKAPCMILKSPVQKLLKSTLKNAEQNMIKNREQFVSSYRCKTPRCKESFYCKTNYRKHLESEKTKVALNSAQ